VRVVLHDNILKILYFYLLIEIKTKNEENEYKYKPIVQFCMFNLCKIFSQVSRVNGRSVVMG
jgi:hypothetical protein